MTVSNTCSGREEQLAAFVDGALPDAERKEIVAHLARCEVCHEILAEVLRLEDDEEDEVSVGRLLTPPVRTWRRHLRWTLPLAAAAILAVALAVLLWDARALESATLVAGLGPGDEIADRLGDDWSESPWPGTRGEHDEYETLADWEASLRLGARVIDLHVALVASDAESQRLASDLVRRVESTVLVDLAVFYREIVRRLEDDEPPPDLLPVAVEAERELDTFADDVLAAGFYRLGKFAEAARLAARAGNAEFFTDERNRRTLEALARELGEDAPPELGQVVPLLEGESELKLLENHFIEILGGAAR